MKKIAIPHPNKKRVLIVVDVQKGFAKKTDNAIIGAIAHVITNGGYDYFVEAVFHAPKGSLWDTQTGWTLPLSSTVPPVAQLLDSKNTLKVIKTTKSVFAAAPKLVSILQKKGIKEVHVVGYDTNDCVLVTANDSFDAGFQTYVIEEGVVSSNGAVLHKKAIDILRNVEMTNHSRFIRSKKLI